ncbi:MAG TPA: hypothetical protein VF581_03190 [Flavobacterium sp.]|jgi:hypothetical protein
MIKGKILDITFWFIFYLFIFIVGFVWAKCYDFDNFEIDNKINVVDIFSIILTFLLAFFVYSYLDKYKEVRVKEKELILNRVQEIYLFIDASYRESLNGTIEYTRPAYIVKRINIQLDNVGQMLAVAQINLHSSFNIEIKLLSRQLKSLMTDSLTLTQLNNLQSQVNPIVISNNIATYSDLRRNQIELKYDQLKNKVSEYQLRINRA